jgi:ammonia channel protein AmtB
MMPGLALFYGGLVGQKNVISSMTHSFVAIGVVSVLWVVVGYSLAFGPNHGVSLAPSATSCCTASGTPLVWCLPACSRASW